VAASLPGAATVTAATVPSVLVTLPGWASGEGRRHPALWLAALLHRDGVALFPSPPAEALLAPAFDSWQRAGDVWDGEQAAASRSVVHGAPVELDALAVLLSLAHPATFAALARVRRKAGGHSRRCTRTGRRRRRQDAGRLWPHWRW